MASLRAATALGVLLLARLLDDDYFIIDELLEVGRWTGESGRLKEAESYFLEAKRRAVAQGYRYAVLQADVYLGAVSLARGDFGKTIDAFERVIPPLSKMDDRLLLPDALLKLGVAYHRQGDDQMATECWSRTLELSRAKRDKRHIALALMNLGGIAYRQGRYDDAERQWDEALPIIRRDWTWENSKEQAAHMAFFLGLLKWKSGRLREARRLLEESRHLHRRLGNREREAQDDSVLQSLEAEISRSDSPALD